MNDEMKENAMIPRLFRDVSSTGTKELPKRLLVGFLLGSSMEIAAESNQVFWFDTGAEVLGRICLKAEGGAGSCFDLQAFKQMPKQEEKDAYKKAGYHIKNEESGEWDFTFATEDTFRYLRLQVTTGKMSVWLKSLDYEAIS